MKKWHMIVDISKCEDCNNCSLACKDEHVDNEWPGYTASQPRHGHRWMDVARKERGQFPLVDVVYRPTTCMQCADAPCLNASHGTVTRRDDGIVLIDPEKAKGQRQLVNACPFGMIWWNEERQVPQKCTFCAHLLDDGWKQPRCVQACPTGALQVKCVEDAEMARIVESEQLECLHPEFKTRPQLFYANLRRFDKCFIGGSIATDQDGKVDCASGATLALCQGEQIIAETTADSFGDFRFDGLEPGSFGYTIDVQFDGFNSRMMQVPQLDTSLNLGTVCLTAEVFAR